MRIGVFGAGAIGCYVGGRLLAAGVEVVLVGRDELRADVAANGLRLSDHRGYEKTLAPAAVTFFSRPAALAACDAILLAVKSQDTATAGVTLAPLLRSGTPVLSLQNGVRNAAALRAALPDALVMGGMVPFNVVRTDGARFHQATSGNLVVEHRREPAAAALVAALGRSGLGITETRDLAAVQWGKLLVNLGNALNALAGLPLQQQLASRGHRLLMAATLGEAAGVLAAANQRATLPMLLPLGLLGHVLRLPNALFRIAARFLPRVDPQARSSMWDDLARQRLTEVDFLNGEIALLAQSRGLAAPINTALVAAVHAAERAGGGSPMLPLAELRRQLRL